MDPELQKNGLFQRIIEYRLENDKSAVIIQPTADIRIDIGKIIKIETPPKYKYGDIVLPLNHIDRKGQIRDIIWHFKNKTFNYYIEADNKKIGKRYYEEELIKV